MRTLSSVNSYAAKAAVVIGGGVIRDEKEVAVINGLAQVQSPA